MIFAVDVKYSEGVAVAAGVVFAGWGDDLPEREVVATMEIPADYQPGRFYKRELPCILKLIKQNKLQPDCIIIDGFVYLDGFSRPGLGKHLYDALKEEVVVIGVAKSHFKGVGSEYQLFRGGSSRPLYVTAAGVEVGIAKEFIRTMHGRHRIPTLLKRVDQLSRMMESRAEG